VRRVLQLRALPFDGRGRDLRFDMATTLRRPTEPAPATTTIGMGPVCPVPLEDTPRVLLGHGSGGKLSARLLREEFLPHLGNDILAQLGDAAIFRIGESDIAMSTDTFVVKPLEFPGGDIGSLSIHGTVNDLAMMGARPAFVSAGFVLEEGLDLEILRRVVRSMGRAAKSVGVRLVTGDTKVVERGLADGIYINTTGVGLMDGVFRPSPDRARPGDAIIVSGPIGRHGIAIMAARDALGFETEIESDSAPLTTVVDILRDIVGVETRVLRDPTRGGVASSLNEIAAASKVGIELDEESVPVPEAVAAACEVLGLDPLYVANEGILLAFVPEALVERAIPALRAHPLAKGATRIGRVVAEHPGMVVLRTAIGGTRVVDMLPGDQLPRIC
jgi:hydrogenase expression/formation protein HypE